MSPFETSAAFKDRRGICKKMEFSNISRSSLSEHYHFTVLYRSQEEEVIQSESLYAVLTIILSSLQDSAMLSSCHNHYFFGEGVVMLQITVVWLQSSFVSDSLWGLISKSIWSRDTACHLLLQLFSALSPASS
jgi:hypothetical protein